MGVGVCGCVCVCDERVGATPGGYVLYLLRREQVVHEVLARVIGVAGGRKVLLPAHTQEVVLAALHHTHMSLVRGAHRGPVRVARALAALTAPEVGVHMLGSGSVSCSSIPCMGSAESARWMRNDIAAPLAPTGIRLRTPAETARRESARTRALLAGAQCWSCRGRRPLQACCDF